MTKRPMIQVRRRHNPYSIYGRFTIFRAAKDGGPLLREEKQRFRDINGFMIQTKRRRIMVEYRRRGL